MVPIKWKHKAVWISFWSSTFPQSLICITCKKTPIIFEKLSTSSKRSFLVTIHQAFGAFAWCQTLSSNKLLGKSWHVRKKHSMGRVDKFTNHLHTRMKVNKADPQTLDILTKKKQLQFLAYETTRFVYNNFIPVSTLRGKMMQQLMATHGTSVAAAQILCLNLRRFITKLAPKNIKKFFKRLTNLWMKRLWFNKELGNFLPNRIFRTWLKHVVSIRTAIHNDIHHFCKALNEFVFF